MPPNNSRAASRAEGTGGGVEAADDVAGVAIVAWISVDTIFAWIVINPAGGNSPAAPSAPQPGGTRP